MPTRLRRLNMTPEELQSLRVYVDFPMAAEELIYRLGIDAAATLISRYPGQTYKAPTLADYRHPAHLLRIRELEALIGPEAAQKMRLYFGGIAHYIPSCGRARWARDAEQKIREYEELIRTGISVARAAEEVSLRHECSARNIEKIVNSPRQLRKEGK
jgi:hypothetical protein